MITETKDIYIVGAGLVGSLLSILLAKRSLNVHVYERRADIRLQTLSAGRSINLALSDRGLKALRLIDLDEEVYAQCIPMYGRMIHDLKGNQTFTPYGKPGQAINSVSRGGLNQMLVHKAGELENINLHFDERCVDVNFRNNSVEFENLISLQKHNHSFSTLFATDGAFSAVRMAMMKADRHDIKINQEYIEHSYKELSIKAGPDDGFQLDSSALHIWPRKSFMMIALPNLDGSFTCTLFLDTKGQVSFERLKSDKQILDFFELHFPDVMDLMPNLIEEFQANPVSSLVTIRCNPWNVGGQALLLGDSAHPIVPFYGQGMNAGFEDCSVLMRTIDKLGLDWSNVFNEFNAERVKDGDAVADLALRNFIEMRDLVADPHFVAKNKIDKKLAVLPDSKWNTLYSMVTFGDMPYHEAISKGKKNDLVLEQIVREHPGIDVDLESENSKEILIRYIG